ncbi:hypothetical protein EDB87DRAFT_159125 [Lactarius vividus]|nr:hypothetical protein EDB87DRAFT_159125 [Lactarius vividus]
MFETLLCDMICAFGCRVDAIISDDVYRLQRLRPMLTGWSRNLFETFWIAGLRPSTSLKSFIPSLGPQRRACVANLRQHRHPHRVRDGAHAAARRDRQTYGNGEPAGVVLFPGGDRYPPARVDCDGFLAHVRKVAYFYRVKRDVFEAAMQRHLHGLGEWNTLEAGMFFWSAKAEIRRVSFRHTTKHAPRSARRPTSHRAPYLHRPMPPHHGSRWRRRFRQRKLPFLIRHRPKKTTRHLLLRPPPSCLPPQRLNNTTRSPRGQLPNRPPSLS